MILDKKRETQNMPLSYQMEEIEYIRALKLETVKATIEYSLKVYL